MQFKEVTRRRPKSVLLRRESKGSALWRRFRGRTGPRSGQGELRGGLLDTFRELQGVLWIAFWVQSSSAGESHSDPKRDFGVDQRRGRSRGSGTLTDLQKGKETDDAEPSQRSPRTLHTFAVWAATRFVLTVELRRECSFRVGACGRRPLESADPARRVGRCWRDKARRQGSSRV